MKMKIMMDAADCRDCLLLKKNKKNKKRMGIFYLLEMSGIQFAFTCLGVLMGFDMHHVPFYHVRDGTVRY